MKYTIKNRPAKYYEFIDDEQKCFLKDKKCKHISDCLLKQIVELCKEKIKVCESCSKTADINIDCVECDEKGEANISRAIINLLEIEEVNE